jgi:superfamily II DNA or RNA helicase
MSMDKMSSDDKRYIQTELVINDSSIYTVTDNSKILRLPFGFAHDLFEDLPHDEVPQQDHMNFTGKLRPEQEYIAKKTLSRLQSPNPSMVIACPPGFGKTITSLSIACQLKVKTVIVINKIILVEQWISSINTFIPDVTVQFLKPKMKIDPDAQFIVINAINISKFPSGTFDDTGLLIVDELHQIVTRILSMNLLNIAPRYVIGLSATPYRFDEYNKAIPWFFDKCMLEKTLLKKHRIEYLITDFIPEVKYTFNGKLDWNAVLNSQSENEPRNKLIVDTVAKYPERTWLILVKRVNHAIILQRLFKDKGIASDTLMRSKLTFDKSIKILIGTTSKLGVGFDHADIDSLFIAADVKNYFVQFLGRCMRRPDCEPIVIDVLDNFSVLKKHFDERVKVYTQHGGSVKPVIEKMTARLLV